MKLINRAALAAASLAAVAGVGLAAAPGASAAPARAASAYVPYIVGTATPKVAGLRLRSGPSTGYRVEGLLFRGDRMTVDREVRRASGSWFHVRLTRRSATGLRVGRTGWVYAAYLRHA